MGALYDWLEHLGLQQHAGVLTDNDIDLDILRALTDGDLERLGLSLGHRRKLLKALADAPDVPGNESAVRDAQAPRLASGVQDAERRQVTVLFCDLVGSTQLANTVDPEVMHELLGRYQDTCAGAIVRFDGMVAKFMGDGVLAYFGYPQAYEDAAERSIRAAMAIVESVKRLARPDARALEVRVGIATGIVVVGDIIGMGISREHSIVGETPNLAARLQGLAGPNAIMVAESTRRLSGRTFEYQSLGERELKGFANPVQVWRVIGEAAVASRFAAAQAVQPVHFVGRAQEMATLLDRWRLARRGEGRAIFLTGDAGIGKSRIVDAFCERLRGESYHHVLFQCSPYHTQSALHPVIRYLERAAGFATEDGATTRLRKLEALLSSTGAPTRASVSLIADLLSLPAEAGQAPLELLPSQRKEATVRALVEQLARLADHEPVLFVLEDAHWIDPTTREVVTRLIDGIASRRVLAIVTARPDPPSPWSGSELSISLTVTRLGRAQCTEMIAGIAAGRDLAPELVDNIVARTDGVPVFVEELTRAVLEAAEPGSSAVPGTSVVPATLHDSLMARLDRLGPVKDIAQVASVIGQQFSCELLQAVASVPPAELQAGIARLAAVGLVLLQESADGSRCSFRHALLRDVAYESMLRGRRQQLHERIARVLEERFPAIAEREPELLAHHFGQAGVADLASAYCERAGDRSLAHNTYAEAVAHFRTGLLEAGRMLDDAARSRRELGLLIKLGPALTILASARSPEVADTYRRAHVIAQSLGDEGAVFKSIWGLWFCDHVSSRHDAAQLRVQELVRLGRQSADADLLLEAFHCSWSTAFFRGDYAAAQVAIDEGITRYDPLRHGWMGAVFGGHDPGVCAHGGRASWLAMSGFRAQARASVERALSLAEMLQHTPSLSQGLQMTMTACQVSGDHESVLRLTQRMLDLADKHSLTTQRAHALFHRGWALTFGSDPVEGLDIMEAEFPRASGGPFNRYYIALLAGIRIKAGRIADALAIVETALASAAAPGAGFYVPELHRLRGECLLQLDSSSTEEALRALEAAVDIAKRQNALLFQFRSAVSLARACVSAGKDARGIGPLRELHAALPEGFEAAELREAEVLLSA